MIALVLAIATIPTSLVTVNCPENTHEVRLAMSGDTVDFGVFLCKNSTPFVRACAWSDDTTISCWEAQKGEELMCEGNGVNKIKCRSYKHLPYPAPREPRTWEIGPLYFRDNVSFVVGDSRVEGYFPEDDKNKVKP